MNSGTSAWYKRETMSNPCVRVPPWDPKYYKPVDVETARKQSSHALDMYSWFVTEKPRATR